MCVAVILVKFVIEGRFASSKIASQPRERERERREEEERRGGEHRYTTRPPEKCAEEAGSHNHLPTATNWLASLATHVSTDIRATQDCHHLSPGFNSALKYQ